MLTLQDCVAMSGLDEAEVDAIAEHEHLPPIIAAELASYLEGRPGGTPAIRQMILDDIEAAAARGDDVQVLKLRLVLRRFCETHPA
jgi:hypothetical protein